MSAVCDKFQEEDRYFLEKSKILASMNVTSEQFGGSENYAIHFSAAVSAWLISKYLKKQLQCRL